MVLGHLSPRAIQVLTLSSVISLPLACHHHIQCLEFTAHVLFLWSTPFSYLIRFYRCSKSSNGAVPRNMFSAQDYRIKYLYLCIILKENDYSPSPHPLVQCKSLVSVWPAAKLTPIKSTNWKCNIEIFDNNLSVCRSPIVIEKVAV